MHLRTISQFRSNRNIKLIRVCVLSEKSRSLVTILADSGTNPNEYALVQVIRACTNNGWSSSGQQFHCYGLRSGHISNVFVSTALINFYLKVEESLTDAHQVFDEMPHPTVFSWNSLISGYVQCGHFRKALGLFIQLDRSDILADSYSFTAALAACGRLNLVPLGMSVHSKVVKFGLECSIVVANCLIDMYGKCSCVEMAIQVFHELMNKDVISWNSIIAASARNRRLEQAFSFIHQMPHPDTISYNEVIDGIAQFGKIEDTIKILRDMPNPNSSSWNSIITGYVNRNRAWEALFFFTKMQSEGVEMDRFTFSIILCGIGFLAALTWGTLVHCCTMKFGLDISIVVGSALIDMYSKCGQVKNSELMFQFMQRKNIVTWNTMISAYAHNGESAKVIGLFKQLKTSRDMRPNEITFLNMFAAFSHNHMPMEIAMEYFNMMIKEYEIKPSVEHCCSLIRIMGQREEVWRAEKMIDELDLGSCALVWRALLGACAACKDLEVAKIAAAKVIELEGDDDYVYVMMSNIYASYGKWGDVSVVRQLMREKGIRKNSGFSRIEEENVMPSLFISSNS